VSTAPAPIATTPHASPAPHPARRRRLLPARLHHEFWPAWLFYLPLLPYLLWLALRTRSLLAFTRVNPGIEQGGGFVGERKSAILAALPPSPHVLPWRLLPRAPTPQRLALLDAAQRDEPRLAYPLILKPERGERGLGVRLVASRDDAARALSEIDADVLAQAFHPGPHECGVLWLRHPPGASTDTTPHDTTGFIYAITRKEFPALTADGVRTLAQLIDDHPRYRLQRRVFRTRLAARLAEVPPAGTRVALGVAGNHAQGALFRDGADLLTPALTRAIDALAANVAGGLDVGRFDIRYESDDALRRGEAFAIVELNGSSSESTNLYDPDRSARWAYAVLFGLWRRVYALGAWRKSQGAPGWSLPRLITEWRRHTRERRGNSISD
jgi:hypothetical protein